MKLNSKTCAALVGMVSCAASASAHAAPIQVPVLFLEALAPRDTTSSERFRKEYESTIALGQNLTEKRVKECGYTIAPGTHFYDASDSLQAREKAAAAEKNGAWLIVGPRRSNHYMLVAGGAPSTPSVSIMAGSSEVSALGSLHTTLYASNEKLAKAAVLAVKSELAKKRPKYVSIVSQDCVVCRDFSETFDRHALASGMTKLGDAKIAGESPDLTATLELVASVKPDFVLIPNYSKVSAWVVGAIEKKIQNLLFVGSDGWGDGKFGFMEKNPALGNASGITLRGFPPTEVGLAQFKLGNLALELGSKGAFCPTSGPGMAILRAYQGISDLLCQSRPKTFGDFAAAYSATGKRHFSAVWGANLYRLKDGNVEFVRSLP